MKVQSITSIAKLLCLFATLSLLQACTTSNSALSSNSISVEDAYLTSGIIPLKPYTRSIISSSNF
jgi:hypothetical protein